MEVDAALARVEPGKRASIDALCSAKFRMLPEVALRARACARCAFTRVVRPLRAERSDCAPGRAVVANSTRPAIIRRAPFVGADRAGGAWRDRVGSLAVGASRAGIFGAATGRAVAAICRAGFTLGEGGGLCGWRFEESQRRDVGALAGELCAARALLAPARPMRKAVVVVAWLARARAWSKTPK